MNDATQYMKQVVNHDDITTDWVMEGVEISLSDGNPFIDLCQDDWAALAVEALQSDVSALIKALKSSPIAQRDLVKKAKAIVDDFTIEELDNHEIIHDCEPLTHEGFGHGE